MPVGRPIAMAPLKLFTATAWARVIRASFLHFASYVESIASKNRGRNSDKG